MLLQLLYTSQDPQKKIHILSLILFLIFYAVKINNDTIAEWINWLVQQVEWLNPTHTEDDNFDFKVFPINVTFP